jgi:RNA polymerase sigma-70 factor (ECF subfamily)
LESGSDAAWTTFVQRFQPLIASSVARVVRRYGAPSPALIDDLTQDTYLRLCKDNCRNLREFRAQHDEAIFGYLKVIATSVALDHFRARTTHKRRGELPDDGSGLEASVSSDSIEQSALLLELEAHVAANESERDRTIFALYYRQGFTARDIAAVPGLGLSQKGVEASIYRLTQSLRNAVNKLKKGPSSPNTLGILK